MTASSRNQLTPDAAPGQAGRVDLRLLTFVAGSLNRRIDTALTAEGFSVDQWRVLSYLDESGPCTMSTLALTTGTNAATLTRLVDRLVSYALVYRSADRGDRRRVLVHLSARGHETTDRLRPLVASAEHESARGLSVEECDELTRLLRCISPVESH